MSSSILGSQFSAGDFYKGALANRVKLAALELIGTIRRKEADWKNGRFIRTLESLDNRRAINNRLTTIILVLFAGVRLGTVAARAQDATWEPSAGAGTGDWHTPGNWTPGSVPTATGTATLETPDQRKSPSQVSPRLVPSVSMPERHPISLISIF
jgi:hypothetical protein